MNDESSRDTRHTLDREHVVAAALALLDEVGLDELSMRRLAERLGVTAAAVYWYVRDKDELLDLLADALSAEMPVANSTGPWRAEIEAVARGAWKVARAHRDVARVLVATLPTTPARLRAIDALVGVLLHAGFSPVDAADAAWVLNVYGVGFMLDEALGPEQNARSVRERAAPAGDEPPLGAHTHGRLIVEHGAVNLTLRGDGALPTLYRMTFEGRPPQVAVADETVRLRQHHGWRNSCTLTLAGKLSWEVHIIGGASRLTADLRKASVSELEITGGVGQSSIQLSQPIGTVPLRIQGGVNKLRVERPPKAALRLHLRRGSSQITLDGMHLGSVGGGTEWASPDYANTSNRYNLELGGGASEVTVAAIAVDAAPTAAAGADLAASMGRWFAEQSMNEYPNLVKLAGELALPDQDRRFEFGLRMLLDGLERRLAAGGRHTPSDGTAS